MTRSTASRYAVSPSAARFFQLSGASPRPQPLLIRKWRLPFAQALAAAAGRAAWGARGLLSGRPASDLHAEQERQAGRRTVAVPEEELITPVRELEPKVATSSSGAKVSLICIQVEAHARFRCCKHHKSDFLHKYETYTPV